MASVQEKNLQMYPRFLTDNELSIEFTQLPQIPIQKDTRKTFFWKKKHSSELDELSKAFFVAFKKISKIQKSPIPFALKTSRTKSKEIQLFLRTTGKSSTWDPITLIDKKEKKAAQQIEFLIHGPAQRTCSRETWLKEFFQKKEIAKEGELFSALRKLATPFPELAMVGTNLWGVLQPILSGLKGSVINLGGLTYILGYYQTENLPLSPPAWIVVKGLLDLVRGKETHVRSDLINLLPDYGVSLDKQERLDASTTQIRACLETFVCIAGIAVAVVSIVSTAAAITSISTVFSIILPAISLVSSLLGVGLTLYQGYRISKFRFELFKHQGRGTWLENANTCNWLIHQVSRTRLDEKQIDIEHIKVPSHFALSKTAILEKIHGWRKTPLENYQGKLEKKISIKESQYLIRAGKKSLFAIHELQRKCLNSPIYQPTNTELKKVLSKVKVDSTFRIIENSFTVALFSLFAVGNIFLIVSACTAQYSLIFLSVGFGLFAGSSFFGFLVALLDIIEMIRTKGLDKKDPMKNPIQNKSVPILEKPKLN